MEPCLLSSIEPCFDCKSFGEKCQTYPSVSDSALRGVSMHGNNAMTASPHSLGAAAAMPSSSG
jgi:hypothetical protein